MISVFGWIASSITLIYKLPQIYKLYKRKTSNDISMFSLLIQSTGYVFYIIHGVTINDYPIIIMGSGALFQSMILVFLFFLYKESNINPIEQPESGT
jgi:MtN3 and saliva related transmembrane protein